MPDHVRRLGRLFRTYSLLIAAPILRFYLSESSVKWITLVAVLVEETKECDASRCQ
jgi:hypothetical protein